MAEGHEHSKQVVQIEQVKQGEQLVHKHVDTPQELYLHRHDEANNFMLFRLIPERSFQHLKS